MLIVELREEHQDELERKALDYHEAATELRQQLEEARGFTLKAQSHHAGLAQALDQVRAQNREREDLLDNLSRLTDQQAADNQSLRQSVRSLRRQLRLARASTPRAKKGTP
jgi:ABC-type transporter Mla subunit MlaD